MELVDGVLSIVGSVRISLYGIPIFSNDFFRASSKIFWIVTEQTIIKSVQVPSRTAL